MRSYYTDISREAEQGTKKVCLIKKVMMNLNVGINKRKHYKLALLLPTLFISQASDSEIATTVLYTHASFSEFHERKRNPSFGRGSLSKNNVFLVTDLSTKEATENNP